MLTGGLGGHLAPPAGRCGAAPRRGGRAQRSAPVGGDFPLLYWITTIVSADLPRIWKCTPCSAGGFTIEANDAIIIAKLC
ncbi:MAG: hypothetical protein LBT01_00110, partial [Spirochaetaceae bacterium]|nr:hypothetical protein [Spirochaetaceae bacterium]